MTSSTAWLIPDTTISCIMSFIWHGLFILHCFNLYCETKKCNHLFLSLVSSSLLLLFCLTAPAPGMKCLLRRANFKNKVAPAFEPASLPVVTNPVSRAASPFRSHKCRIADIKTVVTVEHEAVSPVPALYLTSDLVCHALPGSLMMAGLLLSAVLVQGFITSKLPYTFSTTVFGPFLLRRVLLPAGMWQPPFKAKKKGKEEE